MTKRREAKLGPKGRPYGGSATRLADGGRGGAAPRGSQGSALKPKRNQVTGWTDAKQITHVGALTWARLGVLVSPDEPT